MVAELAEGNPRLDLTSIRLNDWLSKRQRFSQLRPDVLITLLVYV